jgi:hypothetical protein
MPETLTCKVCGCTGPKGYSNETQKRIDGPVCFTCNFWSELLYKSSYWRSVRISGIHYWIEDEDAKGFRGFDGTRYVIRFLDGRERTTTNLWYQGKIPAEFAAYLPDNATFVKL